MANPFLFLLTDGTGDEASMVGRKNAAFGALQQDGVAPDLITFTDFNPTNPSKASVQLIDVINDFSWTQTPATGRHEVPFVRMSEYRVEFNSLMQNIKYQLSTFQSVAGQMAQGKGLAASAATAATTLMRGATGLAKTIIPGTTDKLQERLTVAGLPTGTTLPNYLNPYYGLYGVQPTGFEYYMPYFNTEWKTVGNKWGEIEGGGVIGTLTEIFSKEGTASTLLNTALTDENTLGSYIERPQMYTYGGDGPSTNFSIVLSNTNNEDDVIRNWHLAFMLAYQNLPNKTSKVFLEPPVVYEIEVPGQIYYPYAYIDKLQIINRGSSRVMKIPYYNLSNETVPASISAETDMFRTAERWDDFSSDTAAKSLLKKGLWRQIVGAEQVSGKSQIRLIEAIIPDAYEIQISIKSLLPETKNLLFHSTLGSGTLGRGIYSATVRNS